MKNPVNGLPGRLDKAVSKTAKGITPPDPSRLAKAVEKTAKRGR